MSDKLRISCTGCEKSLSVPRTMIGKKGKCPACGTAVAIKDPAAAAGKKKKKPAPKPEEEFAPEDEYGADDFYDDDFAADDDFAEEDDFAEDDRPRKKKSRSGPSSSETPTADSTLGELMALGPAIWIRIAGGALAAPIAVVWGYARARRRGAFQGPLNPVVAGVVLVITLLAGAVLGAALSLKDVVEERLAAGRPVALPLKLLFGLGMKSLLIWIPIAIFGTLVVTLMTV